jgi:hypothetical protein
MFDRRIEPPDPLFDRPVLLPDPLFDLLFDRLIPGFTP